MDSKNQLKKSVWGNKDYYLIARESSLDITHPGMKLLNNYSLKAHRILDLGCGEGTKASHLYSKGKTIVGVDVSNTATHLAKQQYPELQFRRADLEKLPFKADSFDLVYSAFVLEHLSKPEEVLKEAIRVTKKRGYLILIAPNYGAPNRASPPFLGSRIKKLLIGFISDFLILFGFKSVSLLWDKVDPIATKNDYGIDWDTTIEPYIGSLVNFLKNNHMIIKECTSCWSEESAEAKAHQKIFRIFGNIGIYPFVFWGPHLVVVAQKNEK